MAAAPTLFVGPDAANSRAGPACQGRHAPAIDPDELTAALRERILTELSGGTPSKRVAWVFGFSLERLLTRLVMGRRQPEGPLGAFAWAVGVILLRRRMERR